MVKFDFYAASPKPFPPFLLFVPPAKTQAQGPNPALHGGLRPPYRLCQTGEQRVRSCVVCLPFLTAVPQVCNLSLQHNDRVCVCPVHTRTHAAQEMGRDSTLITWCLSKHQIIFACGRFCNSEVKVFSLTVPFCLFSGCAIIPTDAHTLTDSLLNYKTTFVCVPPGSNINSTVTPPLGATNCSIMGIIANKENLGLIIDSF